MGKADFNLPKWPEMRVIGQSVSAKEAMEIIVRIDHSTIYPSSNDQKWCSQVKKIIRGNISEKDFKDQKYSFFRSIRYLDDITYIKTDRITSHGQISSGWIDWNGSIKTSSHNIGKWPKAEEVLKDWQIIASNFHFLSLRCQLFSGGPFEDKTYPVVEYIVSNGYACIKKPSDIIPKMIVRDEEEEINNSLKKNAERYCTAKQLKEAIALVKNKYSK